MVVADFVREEGAIAIDRSIRAAELLVLYDESLVPECQTRAPRRPVGHVTLMTQPTSFSPSMWRSQLSTTYSWMNEAPRESRLRPLRCQRVCEQQKARVCV